MTVRNLERIRLLRNQAHRSRESSSRTPFWCYTSRSSDPTQRDESAGASAQASALPSTDARARRRTRRDEHDARDGVFAHARPRRGGRAPARERPRVDARETSSRTRRPRSSLLRAALRRRRDRAARRVRRRGREHRGRCTRERRRGRGGHLRLRARLRRAGGPDGSLRRAPHVRVRHDRPELARDAGPRGRRGPGRARRRVVPGGRHAGRAGGAGRGARREGRGAPRRAHPESEPAAAAAKRAASAKPATAADPAGFFPRSVRAG